MPPTGHDNAHADGPGANRERYEFKQWNNNVKSKYEFIIITLVLVLQMIIMIYKYYLVIWISIMY